MITLDLTATTTEEKVLKEYLAQNVSEILADKINNGVPVAKDGKQLISRKTLAGFMKYATEEARKQAEQGATSVCLHSDVVFGWAIHYFEEDSILGTLYNEDGTEYKATKPAPKPKKTAGAATTTETPAAVAPAPKKTNPTGQLTMFDFMDEPAEAEESPVEDDTADAAAEVAERPVEVADDEVEEEPVTEGKPPEKTKISPLYETYMQCQAEFPNTVVAMRVGDFFEIFGEAAVTVAKELSMTLTSRDCGLSERVPMLGYPFHTADAYREKIRTFANIAIIDGEQKNLYPQIGLSQNIYIDEFSTNYTVDKETGEVIEISSTIDAQESQIEDPYADVELMYKIYMLLDQKIEIVR